MVHLGLILVCAFFGSLSTFAEEAPNPTPSPTPPPTLFEPSWKDQVLGRVHFSTPGSNEQGKNALITGQDLLNLLKPLGTVHPALVDQAMALLILNRILDHEMRLHLDPDSHLISDETRSALIDHMTRYVVRAFLIQGAITDGKIRFHQEPVIDWSTPQGAPACREGEFVTRRVFDEDVSQLTHEALYPWLQDYVKKEQAKKAGRVTFKVDWKYQEGGIEKLLEQIKAQTNLSELAPLTIRFEKLPETFNEFHSSIQTQIQSYYQQLRARLISHTRRVTWEKLLRDEGRNPFLDYRAIFSVDPGEMHRLFQLLSQQGRFHIQPISVQALEVIAKGPHAKDFIAFYDKILSEQEKAFQDELNQNPKNPIMTPELKEKWNQKLAHMPFDAYGRAVFEFGLDLEHIDFSDHSIERQTFATDGITPPPQDDSLRSREMRFLFGPDLLLRRQTFPRSVFSNCEDQSVRLLLIQKWVPGNRIPLEESHPQVISFLNGFLREKFLTRVTRDLVYDLLLENSFEVKTSTCSDPSWPCTNLDSFHQAEVLFSEMLYPGESLDPGVTSTLHRYDLNSKVMQIVAQPFSSVFDLSPE